MTTETARLPGTQPVEDNGSRDQGREAAERLVDALAARDYRGLFGALTRKARFRYLIPSGPGEIVGAAEVASKYLDWFGDADALEVEEVLVHRISGRLSARYRFLVHEQQRLDVIEQQAYLDVDATGQIESIDLVCSGFMVVAERQEESPTQKHEFDAGTMGCSDGLAPEFRRRIGAIPVGDRLVVTVRDPAAKEDLPALARMLGHSVRSVDTGDDGRLAITVEKAR